jgi:hypothetical protein
MCEFPLVKVTFLTASFYLMLFKKPNVLLICFKKGWALEGPLCFGKAALWKKPLGLGWCLGRDLMMSLCVAEQYI